MWWNKTSPWSTVQKNTEEESGVFKRRLGDPARALTSLFSKEINSGRARKKNSQLSSRAEQY
jgi:hypothetical protein